MLETLKKNIKNKTWWIAVVSALILLCQSHGIDLTKYIGANWNDTLNTIFSLAVLFGISVDTTAVKDIASDSNNTTSISNSTENAVSTNSDSTNTSVTDSLNSNDSTEDDIKNAIVANSTIAPKANTSDDTTNANA